MIKVSSAVVVDAGALLSGFSWAKLNIAPSASKVEQQAPAVAADKGKRLPAAARDAMKDGESTSLQAVITEFIDSQFDDVDSLQISDTEQFSLTIDLD